MNDPVKTLLAPAVSVEQRNRRIGSHGPKRGGGETAIARKGRKYRRIAWQNKQPTGQQVKKCGRIQPAFWIELGQEPVRYLAPALRPE